MADHWSRAASGAGDRMRPTSAPREWASFDVRSGPSLWSPLTGPGSERGDESSTPSFPHYWGQVSAIAPRSPDRTDRRTDEYRITEHRKDGNDGNLR